MNKRTRKKRGKTNSVEECLHKAKELDDFIQNSNVGTYEKLALKGLMKGVRRCLAEKVCDECTLIGYDINICEEE